MEGGVFLVVAVLYALPVFAAERLLIETGQTGQSARR
jgi:hypothetical protein